MNRDLHKSTFLAPVGDYEPRDFIATPQVNPRSCGEGGTYEYEVGDQGGLCLGDRPLLEMLSRHRDEVVLVRRTR